MWVCVLWVRFWLRPVSRGWVVGVCVFVCSLRLYPATPAWGLRRGCVCLALGFCCAPALLAGVLECICVCVRAPLVPRHPWLGCAVPVGAPCHSWLGCWDVRVHAPRVPRHSWLGCAVWVCVRGVRPSAAPRDSWPEPKHTHPHSTPQPGEASYKWSAHTSTQTPRHPSQECRGAAEPRAQAHTATTHTPAKSGRVQAQRARKRRHTPALHTGVAGHSQSLSPSTQTRTIPPSQECRGTSGARTRAHTHPNTEARSGGEQPKAEPTHTYPHSTPQP